MIRIADYLFGTSVDEDTKPRRWLVRYLGLAVVLALILICRRPDSIFNAQFFGEDGQIFFPQQLTLGFWSALHKLWNGFPYVVQRLIAAFAGAVPLVSVPLAYNVSAIAITALVTATFSLPGFRHLVRGDALRATVCLAMVCIPAGQELVAVTTNLSWWFAPWLAFLSVIRTPRSRGGVAIWCLGGALAVASAPFAPVIAPLWVLRAVSAVREHRGRDLCFAAIQLFILLVVLGTTGGSLGAGDFLQSDGSLVITKTGAINQWEPNHLWSVLPVFPYVAAWCIDAALIPASFRPTHTSGALQVMAPPLALAVCVALAFRHLSVRGRTTICLAAYLYVSSILLTLVGRHSLVRGFQGLVAHLNETTIFFHRYRLLPDAALVLGVAGIVGGARRLRMQLVAALVACMGLVAWAPEFRIPPFVDYDWPLYAARLERQIASGTENRLVIPINPKPYTIVLDSPGFAGSRSGDARRQPPTQ